MNVRRGLQRLTAYLQGFGVMTPEEVEACAQIPAKVKRKIDRFFQCRACMKVFWEGPKFQSTRDKFMALVGDGAE